MPNGVLSLSVSYVEGRLYVQNGVLSLVNEFFRLNKIHIAF